MYPINCGSFHKGIAFIWVNFEENVKNVVKSGHLNVDI